MMNRASPRLASIAAGTFLSGFTAAKDSLRRSSMVTVLVITACGGKPLSRGRLGPFIHTTSKP